MEKFPTTNNQEKPTDEVANSQPPSNASEIDKNVDKPEGRTDYIEVGDDGREYIVSEIKGTWEAVTKNAEGEAEIHTLHKHSIKRRPRMAEGVEATFISQAAPTKITPSRARPKPRSNNVAVDLPDIQFGFRQLDDGSMQPTHSPEAMDVALQVTRDIQPDLIVLGGDELDLPELSRFKPDSNHFNHFTLQASIDGLHKFLAQLRSDNPNARIVNLDSNHVVRIRNFMAQNAMALFGVERAGASKSKYPTMSYPFLVNLEELDIEFEGGYPAETFKLNDRLISFHGDKAVSNGSTATRYLKELDDGMGLMFHHTHREESEGLRRKYGSGKRAQAFSFGCLCDTTGSVPSYGNGVSTKGHVVPQQENWVNGIGVIEYQDGDKPFQPHSIIIDNNEGFEAVYNGRAYRPIGTPTAGYGGERYAA